MFNIIQGFSVGVLCTLIGIYVSSLRATLHSEEDEVEARLSKPILTSKYPRTSIDIFTTSDDSPCDIAIHRVGLIDENRRRFSGKAVPYLGSSLGSNAFITEDYSSPSAA